MGWSTGPGTFWKFASLDLDSGAFLVPKVILLHTHGGHFILARGYWNFALCKIKQVSLEVHVLNATFCNAFHPLGTNKLNATLPCKDCSCFELGKEHYDSINNSCTV